MGTFFWNVSGALSLKVRSSGVVTDLCLGAECLEEQSYKVYCEIWSLEMAMTFLVLWDWIHHLQNLYLRILYWSERLWLSTKCSPCWGFTGYWRYRNRGYLFKRQSKRFDYQMITLCCMLLLLLVLLFRGSSILQYNS